MNLNPKEIRILELAMDVCEKAEKSDNPDIAFHANNTKADLEALRGFFGKSKELLDEPE